MKALILAAGLGQRLETLTANGPKALVTLHGRPLIAHILDFLRHPAITDIAVVGGYHFPRVRETLQTLAPDVACFHNPQYTLGSIESLFAARKYLTDDFLLCNVDHLYRPAMLERVLETPHGITALCDFDRTLGADDMKIVRNAAGCITAMHKQLAQFDGGYIGATRCPSDCVAAYWQAAETTRRDQGTAVNVEAVLGTLARAAHPIYVRDGSGIGWAEVDTPEDLRNAERFLST